MDSISSLTSRDLMTVHMIRRTCGMNLKSRSTRKVLAKWEYRNCGRYKSLIYVVIYMYIVDRVY